MTSKLYSVRDSPSLPHSAEAAATADGLNALRRALELLLQDREPTIELSVDVARPSLTMPGSDWRAVIRTVMDGLLSQRAGQDSNAVSSAFNTLASATSGLPDRSNGFLDDEASPPHADITDNIAASTHEPPVTISISAPDARAIRVIKELPGFRLCQLEGRNGIGKTLAARLLELVSGGQPYSALPNAWSTLKDQLGKTTITINGLPAGLLQFTLTPIRWPEQPNDTLGDLLGVVTLDDVEIEWSQARNLLQVVRIAGDESLVDALARALEERAQQALRWRTVINAMVHDWYTPLLDLQELSDSLSTQHFESLLNEATTAKRAAENARHEAEAAHQDVELASKVHTVLRRAIERREEVPGLIDQLAASNTVLADSVTNQKSVQQQLLTASEALGLDNTRRGQVARWERLRTLRYHALQRARSNEEWYLLQLGEEERPTWPEFTDRKNKIAEQLRQAIKALTELDVTEDVRKLGNSIELPLKQASTTVLRQIIATIDTPVTGKRLLEGIRRRRIEIEGRPTSVEVKAAKDNVESIERTTRLLNYLSEAMETTDRKQENVDESEQALKDLLDQSQGISQEAYEGILDRLRELQEDYVMRLQERHTIQQHLARLLDMEISEVYRFESPTSESHNLAEEEEAEEQILLSGDSVPLDMEQLDIVSSAEEDGSDLPIDASEWASIWYELSRAEHAELSTLGYEISLDLLRKKPSEGAEDQLNSALQAATQRVQGALDLERGKVAVTNEAKEILRLRVDEISESRRRLRTSVKTLIGPGNAWHSWSPGLWRMLEVIGGTRDEIEELDSIQINFDDLRISEEEAKAIRWMEIISWLSGRMSYASDGVRDGLDSLAGILHAQARTLSPRSRIARSDDAERGIPTDYRDIARVQEWSEQELAALLNTEALRQTLFNNATEVSLNLESATVSWTVPSSSYVNRRPLEAFSSGDQVFAYTRARLEHLKNEVNWRGHRLVILDEFGAFVARDRFAQLLEFVYKQALGSIADQVIVMLPLSSDYANEAYAQELVRGASDTGRRSDLLERVRQVKDREYFAVPVEVIAHVASE